MTRHVGYLRKILVLAQNQGYVVSALVGATWVGIPKSIPGRIEQVLTVDERDRSLDGGFSRHTQNKK